MRGLPLLENCLQNRCHHWKISLHLLLYHFLIFFLGESLTVDNAGSKSSPLYPKLKKGFTQRFTLAFLHKQVKIRTLAKMFSLLNLNTYESLLGGTHFTFCSSDTIGSERNASDRNTEDNYILLEALTLSHINKKISFYYLLQ